MQDHVIHPVIHHQFLHHPQHGVDVPIHLAFRARLMENRAADGRIALDLAPVAGLLIEFPGEWQIVEEEIRTDEAQHQAGCVAHQLDRRQRRALFPQADVGLGQAEAVRRHRLAQIGPFGTVATEIRLHDALVAHVVADLHTVHIEGVEIFAMGHPGQHLLQHRIQPGAIGPDGGHRPRHRGERRGKQRLQLASLRGNTFLQGFLWRLHGR